MTDTEGTIEAILDDALYTSDCDNIPTILQEIVDALRHEIAGALHSLGLKDAATPMGAIELLSLQIKEGSERIAQGLNEIADAIRDGQETEIGD